MVASLAAGGKTLEDHQRQAAVKSPSAGDVPAICADHLAAFLLWKVVA